MKENILTKSNKKSFLKLFIIIIIGLLFLFSGSYSYASSGVPTIISYQGRLANSNGDLLGSSGTTYYFKFSIWNVATEGTSGVNRLWPSSDPSSVSATVRQGVFNVNINVPDYNFNTSSDIYLQVEVSSTSNGTFEPISPRQRISSAVFAQISGAVSGTGQSSFGTTTPVSNTIVTIATTTTSAIPLFIRAAAGQLASLFRIEDSSLNHLFSINSSGGIFASSTFAVGSSGATSFIVNSSGKASIGTTTPTRRFNIFDEDSVAQLRLSQASDVYGEFQVDNLGDVLLSSSGGSFNMQNENLWVCKNNCDVTGKPSGTGNTGNIILENALFFDNNFKLAPTTTPGVAEVTMYASSTTKIVPVLIFDDSQ